jgi:hypothetical protein
MLNPTAFVREGDAERIKSKLRFDANMAGGGTAPKMKMNEVFILTGTTLLLGALFMHAWVSPVVLEEGAEAYTNGASMMKGDAFSITFEVENETTVRLVFYDENENIISAESVVLAAGDSAQRTLEAEQGGYYTYEVDTKGVGATLTLDIDRKLMIDLLPFPLGAFFLAFGIYQRKAYEETEEPLDAELDV